MITTFRMDDALAQRLDALAKMTGRSKTFYVLEALREKIDDLEDIYLAERVIEQGGKRYSMKEIADKYDIEYQGK